MSSKWQWLVSVVARKLWFRVTLISLLAVGAALVALAISPYLPENVSAKIGAESVDRLLSIIASSMLTVTTFSLTTIVSAYSAATSNATPRATTLLMQDSTAQNTLSTFIGSFVFSLVAIITLYMGLYDQRSRIVLFGVTVLVLILIVVALLRWISYLLELGRVSETCATVEEAATAAMKEARRRPNLGGVPMAEDYQPPADAHPIYANQIGYIQHVDAGGLNKVAEAAGGEIHVAALPGAYVHLGRPLAYFVGQPKEGVDALICDEFSVGHNRSFDQDPRFGLIALSEIASRALSPAINDPGTAIEVISRAVRILGLWTAPGEQEVVYGRVHVPDLKLADLFDDVFKPIERDGAGNAEVQIRLQKAFVALAAFGGDDGRYARNARRHAREALSRAEENMTHKPDIERVREAAELAAETA